MTTRTGKKKISKKRLGTLREIFESVRTIRAARLAKQGRGALFPVGRKHVIIDSDGILRSVSRKCGPAQGDC